MKWAGRGAAFAIFRFRRRKPPILREWQTGGGPAKQRRFFWGVAEEKLSASIPHIAHIFYRKNFRQCFYRIGSRTPVIKAFSALSALPRSIFLEASEGEQGNSRLKSENSACLAHTARKKWSRHVYHLDCLRSQRFG
ncbi:hypothetical protein DXT96_10850 [Agrobacterium sp. ICMP 6402]|nr:hypothetical protein [Agrobacterium sp. ICMP 6402]